MAALVGGRGRNKSGWPTPLAVTLLLSEGEVPKCQTFPVAVCSSFVLTPSLVDNAPTLRGGAAESLNATGSPASSTGSGTQATKMAAPPQGRAQPVMGISQRVHTGPKKKKDLGTLGRSHPRLIGQSECSDCVYSIGPVRLSSACEHSQCGTVSCSRTQQQP